MGAKYLKAVLVLKDGTIIHGSGFGAAKESVGELVFNTSMTGYQEALTDPSYAGQMLIMTYPLIGNYGTSRPDYESGSIHPSAFVIRELCRDPEHRESAGGVDEFLADNGIPGICGIDTRALVRRIRSMGVMPAILSVSEAEADPKKLAKKMESFDYSAVDFVSKVTIKAPKTLNTGGKMRVVLVDYGVKQGIVSELAARGCEVVIVPSSSSASDIRALEPEGILLSNGPGDPAILKEAHKTIRELEGLCPVFGICLGHQLLAHAYGGDTYKLKFGHRGSNHAVLDQVRGKLVISTQNHGFAVGEIPDGFEVTHTNVNDRSIEGMRCPARNIISLQYHPEARPGPHDSRYLFDEFVKMMK